MTATWHVPARTPSSMLAEWRLALSDFIAIHDMYGCQLVDGPLDGQWTAAPYRLGRATLSIMADGKGGVDFATGKVVTYWHIYRTRFFHRTIADYIGTETHQW